MRKIERVKLKMKRYVSFLLVLVLALSLMGCGAKNDGQNGASVDIADSVTLLNTVWASYNEDEMFPVGGGDFASEETSSMEGPAAFGITDGEVIDSMLGYPQTELSSIEDAASMMHMMNGNTFTCGSYKVKQGADQKALEQKIRDNIQSRQWICGCPDKILIASVGSYIVAAFGEEEIMNTYKEKLLAAYPTATIAFDEAIQQ